MGLGVGGRAGVQIQRYADLGAVADVVPGAPQATNPAHVDAARAFLGVPPDRVAGGDRLGNLLDVRAPDPGVSPEDPTWRAHFAQALVGDRHRVPKPMLRALQGAALTVLSKHFTNEFNDDGALLAAVRGKQRYYEDVPAKALAQTIFGDMPRAAKMTDALQLVLRTFDDPTDDAMLRAAVLDKLGKMGGAADVPHLVRFARKQGGDELRRSLKTIRQITQRVGNPDIRGGLREDPEIGPLLAKPHRDLSDAERTRIIEAVLAKGTVQDTKLLEGGTNLNRVYFVTFAETLGEGGPRVRGVFKPELTDGRVPRANFSREVAVYEGLERVLGTGLVAPTVETMLERPDAKGQGAWLGSMQYLLPNSVPFGSDSDKGAVNGQFRAFIHSAKASLQLRSIRMLCYICGSGDHFMNSDHYADSPIYNFNNFMVQIDDGALHGLRVKYGCTTEELIHRTNGDGISGEDRERVFDALDIMPIDFGSSLGNLPEPIKRGVLPGDVPRGMVDLLAARSSGEAARRVGRYVSGEDAGTMKSRFLDVKSRRGR